METIRTDFRFCPSVFFYLCTVIPSVWFLELDLAERRSKFNVTQALGLVPADGHGNLHLDLEDTLPVGSHSSSRSFISLSRRTARPLEDSRCDVDADRRANPPAGADHRAMVATGGENDDTGSTLPIAAGLHRDSR